jgi:hypothetical protein
LTGIALISLIQAERYTKRLLGQPSPPPPRPSTRRGGIRIQALAPLGQVHVRGLSPPPGSTAVPRMSVPSRLTAPLNRNLIRPFTPDAGRHLFEPGDTVRIRLNMNVQPAGDFGGGH